MTYLGNGKREDDFPAKLWTWMWGAVFVVGMTVISVYTPALSGYTPSPDQRTTIASLPAAQSMK